MTILPELSAAELAAILDQTRKAARAARPASADSPAEQAFRQALVDLAATRSISYHWPLLPTNPFEWLPILCNRLVRRYLRWYIGRIVEQQNAANDAVMHTIELLGQISSIRAGSSADGAGVYSSEPGAEGWGRAASR